MRKGKSDQDACVATHAASSERPDCAIASSAMIATAAPASNRVNRSEVLWQITLSMPALRRAPAIAGPSRPTGDATKTSSLALSGIHILGLGHQRIGPSLIPRRA